MTLLNSKITGSSLSEITDKAIISVIEDGEENSSRNGRVLYLNNVLVELDNPLSRHLNLKGRNNNIYATIAELFWIMSGTDRIDPFLSFFLPRAANYSDDGVTWRGGYGPRIYMDNQLENAINVFKEDGLDTRRSVISVYDSKLDSGVSSKDIPCNNLIHFLVGSDGRLNMNVVSRSSDVIWGLFGINIPEWTFLQEYVAQRVGVPVGVYTHFTSNLHIYDATGKQAVDVYNTDQEMNLAVADRPCIFPEADVREFFQRLTHEYSKVIEGVIPASVNDAIIDKIFADYGVNKEENTLYDYATLLSYYISGKKGIHSTDFDAMNFHPELRLCVEESKFTSFNK
jgi:hypothetical protein